MHPPGLDIDRPLDFGSLLVGRHGRPTANPEFQFSDLLIGKFPARWHRRARVLVPHRLDQQTFIRLCRSQARAAVPTSQNVVRRIEPKPSLQRLGLFRMAFKTMLSQQRSNVLLKVDGLRWGLAQNR